MSFLMQHDESYDLLFFLLCNTTKISKEEDEEKYKMWEKYASKILVSLQLLFASAVF